MGNFQSSKLRIGSLHVHEDYVNIGCSLGVICGVLGTVDEFGKQYSKTKNIPDCIINAIINLMVSSFIYSFSFTSLIYSVCEFRPLLHHVSMHPYWTHSLYWPYWLWAPQPVVLIL